MNTQIIINKIRLFPFGVVQVVLGRIHTPLVGRERPTTTVLADKDAFRLNEHAGRDNTKLSVETLLKKRVWGRPALVHGTIKYVRRKYAPDVISYSPAIFL